MQDISTAQREEMILSLSKEVEYQVAHAKRRDKWRDVGDLIGPAWISAIKAVDNYNPLLNVSLKSFAAHSIRGGILDSLCLRHPLYLTNLDNFNVLGKSTALYDSIDCRKLLAGLKNRNKQICELFFWEGLTLIEIAYRFDVSPTRIRQIVQTAIAVMRGKVMESYNREGEELICQECGARSSLKQPLLHEKTCKNTNFSALTPKQREVATMLSHGKTVKDIAEILKLSTRTIEVHKNNIFHRLTVHNSAELTRVVVEFESKQKKESEEQGI